MGCFTTQGKLSYSFNRKGIFPIKRILGFGPRWKWKGLGKDLGMTSHSRSKEEVIFFSFQTIKPRKNKTRAKTSKKTKKKKGPKIRLLQWCCFLCRNKNSPNATELFDNLFGTKEALEASWEDQKVKEVSTRHRGVPAPPPLACPGGFWAPQSPSSRETIAKNPINTKKPRNNPRSEVSPPQASVARKKTNWGPVPAPCRRGKSSPEAIFNIPMATMMRREQSVLKADGLYYQLCV